MKDDAVRKSVSPDEAELDQQATAQADARVGVSIEDVERWIESWGQPDEKPKPKAEG